MFTIGQGWPIVGKDSKADTRRRCAVEALLANHTLLVGQSRSGKTNAARVIVEQGLLCTKAKVVILDPNADFKHLRETADPASKANWAPIASKVAVVARDGDAWGMDWSTLSLAEMAAFLRIDPNDDFALYRQLYQHRQFEENRLKHIPPLKDFIESLYFQAAAGESLDRYKLRLKEIDELGVIAAADKPHLDSALGGENRAVVVDLSVDNEQVKSITAGRVLEVLWRDGEKKRQETLAGREKNWTGTLVVIDEAHMFVPPEGSAIDLQKRHLRERVLRFADQGKKLNLYLMLITQQPAKLHSEVLSECNNRVILRMGERRSLAALERVFGGLPGRYDGAVTFEPGLGEALIEGELLCDETPPSPIPRGIRFAKALTKEGGATLSKEWASPKV